MKQSGSMEKAHLWVALSGSLISCIASCNTNAATFTPIHNPPDAFAEAFDVSGDGSVVVGTISRDSRPVKEAFRWTKFSGVVGLGVMVDQSLIPYLNYYQSICRGGVSYNGSVIVGQTDTVNYDLYEYPVEILEAFRWTSGNGMDGLGTLERGGQSAAYDVSNDGSVVTGTSTSYYYNSNGNWEAFRWTSEGGMEGLGTLPGSYQSIGEAISNDGNVIVGTSTTATSTQTFNEAYRWTKEDGMEGLGFLPGGRDDSRANAVSADGSVVVGVGNSEQGTEGFRWTRETGMVGLGTLPGGNGFSYAWDVSADGSVIIGSVGGEVGAFIWSIDDGMKSLASILTAAGVDFSGWYLSTATGISDDANTIVGWGYNPDGLKQSFIVDLVADDIHEAVPGDITGDGVVNAADVLICTRVLLGLVDHPDELVCDVAPLDAQGIPQPDGQINVGDIGVLQKISLGI